MHHHAGNHVILERHHGDRAKIRTDRTDFSEDAPPTPFPFSPDPGCHPALEYISTNIIANILGLGWAATPAGLKAMEALKELEDKRRKGEVSGRYLAKPFPEGTANNEMCTFLIINISSLQLIPVNMIAYRSQYGSPNPVAVVGPALLATLFFQPLWAWPPANCWTVRRSL